MPKEYRGRIRIYYDLLHAAANEPGIGTSRLQQVCNLSSERLAEYLAELRTRTLLEERVVEGRKAYHVTPKGVQFLAELRRIQSFMSDFGLDM
jgi:predicted transcriptional regulator